MIRIISPLFVDLPRKTMKDKRIYLNLGVYRNLHYILNNQAKMFYNSIMFPQLKDIPRFKKPVDITFILFKGSKRKIDRANILSIVEKFFCDALVEYGCLEDDCDDYISGTHYRTGGIDRDYPRVEIEIKEIDFS